MLSLAQNRTMLGEIFLAYLSIKAEIYCRMVVPTLTNGSTQPLVIATVVDITVVTNPMARNTGMKHLYS